MEEVLGHMMEEELEWGAQLVLEMENGCTDGESE